MTEYPVSEVCRILEVPRSSYYYKHRPPSRDKLALEKKVVDCFTEHKEEYGKKRIKQALAKNSQPVVVSLSFIARVLKDHNLHAKAGRKRKKAKPEPSDPKIKSADLIKDKYAVQMPNYLWCFDNTELPYKNGKFYVCGGIDVATRRLVGCSWGLNQRSSLAIAALMDACGRNPSRPIGAVYHSDNGGCFTSKVMSNALDQMHFRRSLSRLGHPMDNQPIESFWHTLKTEMPDTSHMSYEDVVMTVFEYIIDYNANRIHSSIDYLTPNEKYQESVG